MYIFKCLLQKSLQKQHWGGKTGPAPGFLLVPSEDLECPLSGASHHLLYLPPATMMAPFLLLLPVILSQSPKAPPHCLSDLSYSHLRAISHPPKEEHAAQIVLFCPWSS